MGETTEIKLPEVATDLTQLTTEDKNKVEQIKGDINVEDTQLVIQYGISAQSKIAGFAETVLSDIRTKDTGYVGEVLTDLMMKVKDLNIDSISPEGNFLSKIPIIGGLVNAFQRFVTQYEKVSVNIEKLIDALEQARMQLLRDLTMMDKLYANNLDYLKELDIFILAGSEKVKELTDKVLPELKAKAESTKDPMDAQKVNDFAQLINRFEKKIYDLKLSRMIAIQTAPQIRLIQNNNQVLVEKIQSSILNTIPLWKSQIIIAISLFRQKKALELQKDVNDTTNELLRKNSEMLKQNSLEVARESEKGIVEIDTLKKVNSDLISTIEETIKIQAEGKEKRKAAEVELTKMETELKEKLIAVKTGAESIRGYDKTQTDAK